MSGRTIRTDRARATFLDTLRQSCNVSEAARTAGISRSAAYEWRDADAEFALAWTEAEEEAADRLEREAWRRAVDGTDKPVMFQGRITDTYKEYSDRMLEILLKAHRPEKFVERVKSEVTGRNGGPIQTADVTTATLIEEAKRLGIDPASLGLE